MINTNNFPEENNTGMSNKNENIKKKSTARDLVEYLITLGIVVAAVFLVNSFILVNMRIPSESMENTIMKKDQVFGFRLAYLNNDPERFDIVVFKFPDDESQYFIKRIIGLPGETVHIRDGKVYINDSTEPLDDSFTPEPQNEEPGNEELVFEVPENSYFVMGDNRNCSNDSRYWTNHYVSRDKIIGKAIFRYWPFTRIGIVK